MDKLTNHSIRHDTISLEQKLHGQLVLAQLKFLN